MAAEAGFVGADREGEDEKAVDGRKMVAPVVEGRRGLDLRKLVLWDLAKGWSQWMTCGPLPYDRLSISAGDSLHP